MKRIFPVLFLAAAITLGGCASAGYNPNATEPSWSKSLNQMGNDVSNSVTPDAAQSASEDMNKAGNDVSNSITPDAAQKASEETNRAASQADSSLNKKNTGAGNASKTNTNTAKKPKK